jgi:chromosome condensin MukBEF MukE localization factor
MAVQNLTDLYSTYLNYKDNQKVVELSKDYQDFNEINLPKLKCYSRMKIRALGSIIKIHKESDEFEVNAAIVNFWFELRSEWIRCNTVNNYTMIMTGTADDVSVVHSSFVAALLEDIEKLISEEELSKINDIMVSVQNGMY